MKKFFCYALAGVLMLGNIACSDDDSSVQSEWNTNYIGIQRTTLGVMTETITLEHTQNGLGTTNLPITVTLSKYASHDITATLDFESDCPEAWTLESNTVVIPAGQLSATVMLSADWSFAEEITESKTWNAKLTLASVDPMSGIHISTKYNTLDIVVTKSRLVNVSPITPAGELLTDNKDWTLTYNGIKDTDRKLLDNKLNTYVWVYNSLDIQVDLGKTITVTGLRTESQYGPEYSPTAAAIYTSNDGKTWDLQGELNLSAGSLFFFALIKPVECRYIRCLMTGTNCLVCEFDVYGLI